jgi:hypothetical protein
MTGHSHSAAVDQLKGIEITVRVTTQATLAGMY